MLSLARYYPWLAGRLISRPLGGGSFKYMQVVMLRPYDRVSVLLVLATGMASACTSPQTSSQLVASPTVSPSPFPTQTRTPPGRPPPSPVPSPTPEPSSTALPPSEAITTATPFSEASLFAGTALFTSQECGFQFRHPTGWNVQPAADEFSTDYPCLFGLRPPDWEALANRLGLCLGRNAIYVGAVSGSLPQVANALRLFMPPFERDGRWFTYDNQLAMEFEVPAITAGQYTIVRDGITTRMYKDCIEGEFAGLDMSNSGLVVDETEHVVLVLAVPFSPHAAFEIVLASLRFLPAQ